MSGFLGTVLFSSSSFFFVLAFIFAICGYFTPWLVPQDQYTDGKTQIDSVGLKQACFTNFIFALGIDKSREVFDSCYDNQRNSARFENVDRDVWSPSK